MKAQQFFVTTRYGGHHIDIVLQSTRLEFAPERRESVGAEGMIVWKTVCAEFGVVINAQPHRPIIARFEAGTKR
jgi:hypothetical protein